MASNTVDFQFFGSAAAAEKAIVGLEKKYEDLQAKIRATSQESRRKSEESSSALADMGGKLASLAGRYLAIPAVISSVVSAQRQLTSAAEQTANTYDEMFRKFRVQSGLVGVSGKEAKERILDIAQKNAVSEEVATRAATQLVSSGFSPQESSGRMLDLLLQTLQATNQGQNDPTEITKAVAQFMAAGGMEKTAANAAPLMVGGQRLFKETDFQLIDLGQLAGKSAGMAGKLNSQEILGAFDVVRMKKNADTASTGLKIFVERLSGSLGDKQRMKELSALNLKPQDVDFVGENLGTILDKLGGGLEGVAPEKRAGIVQRLFGTEGAEAAEILIRDRADIGKAIAVQRNLVGFESDVSEATSGRGAANRRAEVARNRFADRRADDGQMIGEQLAMMNRESGISELQTSLRKSFYETLRSAGASPETAAFWSSLSQNGSVQEARRRTEESMAPAQDQNRVLDRQTALLQKIAENTGAKPVNRNAQQE